MKRDLLKEAFTAFTACVKLRHISRGAVNASVFKSTEAFTVERDPKKTQRSWKKKREMKETPEKNILAENV